MALTENEIERRRQFLTGSEVPALFGLGFMSATDVWLLKTQGVMPSSNPATEAGNLLEPAVLSWADSKIGPLTKSSSWRVHPNGFLAATLDDTTKDGDPVEAKTSCIVHFGSKEMREQWGDEGTDDIPPNYMIQVQTQLLVTDKQHAFVPALIGGRGFVMYEVDANESLQTAILDRCEEFWEKHVLARVQPVDDPSLEIVRRIKRTDGKRVQVDPQFVFDYIAARDMASKWKEIQETAQAKLIAALGDAEIGMYANADGVACEFSYLERNRKGYYVKPSTYRSINVR